MSLKKNYMMQYLRNILLATYNYHNIREAFCLCSPVTASSLEIHNAIVSLFMLDHFNFCLHFNETLQKSSSLFAKPTVCHGRAKGWCFIKWCLDGTHLF